MQEEEMDGGAAWDEMVKEYIYAGCFVRNCE